MCIRDRHYIEQLRSDNKMTIFLTTHYMDEADALCDRIAIIDRGVIKAIDAPGALKDQLGGDVIFFRFAGASEAAAAATLAALQALPDVKELSRRGDEEHVVAVSYTHLLGILQIDPMVGHGTASK